ncbi:MAG: winged helix-turn-helix domain-containing protein [Acidobacteria bacterium]|nr:winged helix-turn-helix domain-containing protein [Acidobacteriota bacterium]MCB9399516.1 winged helix-turn-helix domain-containing protein [Acidobacteriota bacterium]
MSEPGYTFGNCCFYPTHRKLICGEQEAHLSPRYLDVLDLFLRHPGVLFSKEELFEKVWADTFVSDSALTQCIKDIRKTIGDSPKDPQFIKTIPKTGYMFIGKVNLIEHSPTQENAFLQNRPPFFGLNAYLEKDAAVFWGRSEEIQQLCAKIHQFPLVVLHGKTGIGKSSLVQAGVIPQLKKAGWACFQGLDLLEPQPGLWVLDPFENHLFPPEQQVDKLVSQLKQIQHAGGHLLWVVEDTAFPQLNRLLPHFPNLFHNCLHLQGLKPEIACQIIERGFQQLGHPISLETLRDWISQITEDGYVDPTLLQVGVGDWIEHSDEAPRLERAFQNLLERTLFRFEPKQLAQIKQFLQELVNDQGQAQAVRLESLRSLFPEEADLLWSTLVQARVLRAYLVEGHAHAELGHPSLARLILRQIDAATESDQQLRRQLANAISLNRDHQWPAPSHLCQRLMEREPLPYLAPAVVAFVISQTLQHGIPLGQQWAQNLIDQPHLAQMLWSEGTAKSRSALLRSLPENAVAMHDFLSRIASDLTVDQQAEWLETVHRIFKRDSLDFILKTYPSRLDQIRLSAQLRETHKASFSLRNLPFWRIFSIMTVLTLIRLAKGKTALLDLTARGGLAGFLAGLATFPTTFFAPHGLPTAAGFWQMALSCAALGAGFVLGQESWLRISRRPRGLAAQSAGWLGGFIGLVAWSSFRQTYDPAAFPWLSLMVLALLPCLFAQAVSWPARLRQLAICLIPAFFLSSQPSAWNPHYAPSLTTTMVLTFWLRILIGAFFFDPPKNTD